MAQFAAQGRLKLLFNSEWVSFGSEPKDPFVRSVRIRKTKHGFVGSAGFNSVCRSKKLILRARGRLDAGDKGVYGESESDNDYEYDSEFEGDELACFRGLVLDISYRLAT